MAYQLAAAAPRISRWKPWQRDLGAAILVAAGVVLVHAAQGFPLIYGPNADNDSLMRMVEVLDFLSGQGWYDLHQYRMGPIGGFVMHWSRFVDLPIAMLLVLARTLTGSLDAAEKVVEIVYPALLMIASLFLLLRLVRRLGGDQPVFPAIVIGALALYQMPLFQGAALDHHNVQLVLVLVTILFLFSAPERPLAGFAAGVAAALSLVVGMETAPYVALAGVIVALGFLFRGSAERLSAAAFGAGFAGISFLSFLATVPWPLWRAPHCDAFSLPQMSVTALAGVGLAVAALLPGCHSRSRSRVLSLLVLALAVGALVVWAFPQCIAAPYADLDPRLQTYWINSITEAQSIRQVLAARPVMAATYYCTPVLAVLTLVLRARRSRPGREEMIFGAFLVAALFVSFWQVRGIYFSIPLSVAPLAIWVAKWRARVASQPEKGGGLKLVAVWLLSFNVIWSTTAQAAAGLVTPGKMTNDVSPKEACISPGDYSTLASLPPATVLAVFNLGAPILRYTSQRALSGPYHRNNEGGLAMLDALTGSDAQARTIVRRYGVTLVASCPGNAETKQLEATAPAGLASRLAKGDVPAWLAPVSGSAQGPLKLYRVVSQ